MVLNDYYGGHADYFPEHVLLPQHFPSWAQIIFSLGASGLSAHETVLMVVQMGLRIKRHDHAALIGLIFQQ